AAAGTGGTANLTEVSSQTPYEGTQHYRFEYAFTGSWAGLGLNMDNWGANAPRDFSGHSHLRIAYRGLSGAQTLTISLRNGDNYGHTLEVGPATGAYTVVDVPMFALTAGSTVSPSAVREIDLSIASNTAVGNGAVFIDAIELVNVSVGGGGTSAATMARANALGRGINTSNWLEAYWLLPFNAYPEVSRYTRAKVQALRNAGFQTFRLPVTFERLGSTTAPYTLNFNHIAFSLIDSMIVWANDYDFRLIIDNHHGYPLTNANYAAEIPRLNAVWAQLTQRYDHLDPDRFLFEIYNEPTNEISNANWRSVAQNLLATIRMNETQTHSVLVGASSWNSGPNLIAFTPLSDQDVIYTFHSYDPYYFTHQGMSWTSPAFFPPRAFPQTGEIAAINQIFAAVKAWGDNYEVPVNLGEFGCSTEADADSRCNWITALMNAINANELSYFYWDAISPSDAFGFFNDGIIDEAHAIPCFAEAMGLFAGPTGANSVVSDQNIRVFPNPVSGLVTVESDENGAAFQAVQLYSLSGQLLYQQVYALEDGKKTLAFSMAEYPAGAYFLAIRMTDGGMVMRKVVRQ
ncbi:MAG: cellulase family glycosylhydrolase, partial [Saprospiraceae bacterium]|nr:cellulase family glycosylhydrolase [Saprospiraceae bacterium]